MDAIFGFTPVDVVEDTFGPTEYHEDAFEKRAMLLPEVEEDWFGLDCDDKDNLDPIATDCANLTALAEAVDMFADVMPMDVDASEATSSIMVKSPPSKLVW